ncbi:unnamed protein product [Peronospora belbahrii]|uniref:Integrase catalytic domain-containing protein n=1 Tax=Peronospora belbahrii TaxID=622444 RepID=A0AAU9L2W7_9STRA|nr:unnamed protein product [Peronospora belbahrii]CAH0514914.1 unnamed protein product [Peronospora belbahrii]
MIKQEYTVPHNPEQNDMEERMNRTMTEITHCMLSDVKLARFTGVIIDDCCGHPKYITKRVKSNIGFTQRDICEVYSVKLRSNSAPSVIDIVDEDEEGEELSGVPISMDTQIPITVLVERPIGAITTQNLITPGRDGEHGSNVQPVRKKQAVARNEQKSLLAARRVQPQRHQG